MPEGRQEPRSIEAELESSVEAWRHMTLGFRRYQQALAMGSWEVAEVIRQDTMGHLEASMDGMMSAHRMVLGAVG